MPFFSKVFRSKDSTTASRSRTLASQNDGRALQAHKPTEDAWIRREVSADEVQELVHACTQEMKARALNMPFLLLPFRPVSDPSAAKYFVRNFFQAAYNKSDQYQGQGLFNELRLVEPMVLGSILKWCWSRLRGGVVTWDTYELFKVGERESNMAKHAFDTFIPLSVESDARRRIVFDFFDLLAAIAANGKTNGLGGRKLSRMAGWWAFEFSDVGKGFDGGYRLWESAADATCHLFFAYLRSLSSDSSGGVSGISKLPRSLEALLSQTEYPPEPAYLLQTTTPKVVMIVNSVSPTPFALLRRAKHFEYRDDDRILQKFSDYDDPVQTLTPECRRVLEAISSTNRNVHPTFQVAPVIATDNPWSRFEDVGFSSLLDGPTANGDAKNSLYTRTSGSEGLKASPASQARDLGRPTTPSWADFLSEGFADGSANSQPQPLLLPPNQILPPISPSRIHSSQSHVRNRLQEDSLEPGELASINKVEMDETFWWVWMTSLAGEEPPDRKAVFGRCALIETEIQGGRWLIMEEQVKGASPGPEEGAYVAEKKSRFTLSRGKTRRRSTGKKAPDRRAPATLSTAPSKTSILPAQQAKVQAAAAALIQEQKDREASKVNARRSRTEPDVTAKTTSVMTLQPVIMKEAAPAMKWASKFDKEAIRAKYLGDSSFGKGESRDNLFAVANGDAVKDTPSQPDPTHSPPKQEMSDRELSIPPPAETVPEPETESITPPHRPSDPPAAPLQPLTSTAERKMAAPAVDEQVPPTDSGHAHTNGVVKDEPEPMNEMGHEAQNIQEPTTTQPAVQEASPRTNRAPTIEAAVKAWESKAQSSNATPEKPITIQKAKKPSNRGFKKLFSRNKTEKPTTQNSYLAVPQSTIVNRQTPAMRKSVPSDSESPYVNPAMDPRQVQSDFGVIDGGEPGPVISNSTGESYPHELGSRAGPEATGSNMAPAELGTHPRTPSPDSSREPEFNSHNGGDLYGSNATENADMDSLQRELHDGPANMNGPSGFGSSVDMSGTNKRDTFRTDRTYDLADDETSEADRTSLPSHQNSTSQVTDRWAQIRKNAAERRASEEQSQISGRPSQSGRTVGTERSDEGETSGEETIESRVARIKARVAELTGNLESSRADDSAGAGAHMPLYNKI